MKDKSRLFHPLMALNIGLCTTLLFAGVFALLLHGEKLIYHLYYTVPVALPFVAFVFDRIERRSEFIAAQRKLDAATVFLALLRSISTHYLSFFSGHALFLTYSLLTSRSLVARITAILIGIEVLIFKIFVWHNPTWIGGIVLGYLAARWFQRLEAGAASPPPPVEVA